jgi:hypothetical protein
MSTYNLPNVNQRPPQLVDSGFYCDVMFDPDDSAPNYVGLHTDNGADTASNNSWKVLKFTYSGGNVTRIQTAYGAWVNRASLF